MRKKHQVKHQNYCKNTQHKELELSLIQGLELEEFELLTLITSKHLNFTKASKLAKILIARFENITGVLNASDAELLKIDWVTRSLILEFRQMQHLVLATSKASVQKRCALENHENVMNYCKALMSSKKREELHALFLDSKCELVHHECLQIGTVDHVAVYPRELMLGALRHCATYIILAHNHPAGASQPNKADVNLTKQLQSIGFVMGVKILDHIIISQQDAFSFLQNGLMTLPRCGIEPDLHALAAAGNELAFPKGMEGRKSV